MASIDLEHVDLTFRVRQQHQITMKEYLLKGMFRQSRNPVLEVRALQDLSLHLGDGRRLGVIGANGSGKSTLLRLMAGVYHPTAGCRTVAGKVSALFDLALGFEMEANGWKNIRFRGFLNGETAHSIRDKAPGIADFSELGDFLKIPVRYYSAGMMVRLAFSAATAIEPEILLVDEVLGAGDLAFQGKAERRLNQMMEKARILVVVSHNLAVLPRLCEDGLWLEKGRIHAEGPIDEVIAAYVESTQRARAVAA
ncbi:MAG TPA: ABC transporter ATP-binding protein [Gemmataceae bacterium]|nr:ABC transporter ATP-binding protein [Gemmataceae bacterium]